MVSQVRQARSKWNACVEASEGLTAGLPVSAFAAMFDIMGAFFQAVGLLQVSGSLGSSTVLHDCVCSLERPLGDMLFSVCFQ